MKKQSISLSIPTPCTEDWETMTPNEKGRHCANCNKTVIDFSLYTDKELVEFFKNVKDGICGHIPKYQLDRVIAVQQPSRFPFLRKFAWLTAVAGLFSLVSKADAQTKPTTVSLHKAAQKDSTQHKTTANEDEYASFTIVNAHTKKAIPYVSISINGMCYGAKYSNGIYKVHIPQHLIGKKATFEFESENYLSFTELIDLSKLPMSKEVSLTYQKKHVMVNGGMVARPHNNDL